jgi:hypothetical protein
MAAKVIVEVVETSKGTVYKIAFGLGVTQSVNGNPPFIV